MAKAKGSPKTGGRKPGSLNKMKLEVKAAIAQAFDEVGGKDYLVKLATEDQKTFCALLGRLVPTTVGGDPDGVPIKQIIEVITGVPRKE